MTAARALLQRHSYALLALAAVLGAELGQETLANNQPVIQAMLWYGTACVLMLLSILPPSARPYHAFVQRVILPTTMRSTRARLGLVFFSLLVNTFALTRLDKGAMSTVGLIAWLLSMAALVTALVLPVRRPAFLGGEPKAGMPAGTRSRRSPLELELAVLILALGFVMRWYRLDLYPSGTHGDEGEMGIAALSIIFGKGVPPFGSGYFFQGANLFYYAQALSLQWFGADLVGLRTLSALAGAATLVPLYLLVRLLFNWRVAAIASFLLAVSNVHIHFSRMALSNVPTGLLWVVAFCLILVGLKRGNLLWTALGGLAAGLDLYGYVGSQLLPFIIALLFMYLLVAQRTEWRSVLIHGVIVLIGAWLVVAPLVVHFVQAPNDLFGRTSSMAITNNENAPGLEARYGTTAWPQVLVGQATNTLSVFFTTGDVSTFYDSNEPILPASIAALFLLGLCYAAARTLEPRFFVLNLWFWSVFVMGGVYTIQAPYVPRLTALLPVMVVFPALVIDKVIQLIRRAGTRRLALVAMVFVPVFLAGVGYGEWDAYFIRFANKYPWPGSTGQANYVASLGPGYHVYVIGTPYVYFEHGSTRFAAPYTTGQSLHNPPELLPLTGPFSKDVAFVVWPQLQEELALLRYFYPHGKEEVVTSGTGMPVFTGFRVSRDDLQRSMGVSASFYKGSDWQDPPVQTEVMPSPGFTSDSAPPGLGFPASAVWRGSLYVSTFGRYTLRIGSEERADFTIDGEQILHVDASRSDAQVELELSKGLHPIEARAVLPAPTSAFKIGWAPAGSPLQPLPPERLLNRVSSEGLLAEVTRGDPGGTPVLRRFDPTVAFRDMRGYAGQGGDFSVRWTGNVKVVTGGPYIFETLSDGISTIAVDGTTLLTNDGPGPTAPRMKSASVTLTTGQHDLQVTYRYQGGPGFMELYWTPPGGKKALVSPDALLRSKGH